MRRQRNMFQMKEQKETPEKELNKMEISNLSDAEFKQWLLGCSRKVVSKTGKVLPHSMSQRCCLITYV